MTNKILGEGWVSIQFRWNPQKVRIFHFDWFLVFLRACNIEFSCSFQSFKDLTATAIETLGFFPLRELNFPGNDSVDNPRH